MKKYTIMALILVVSLAALTGCRRRNDTVTESTATTMPTTQATTAPVTMPTTEATTVPTTEAPTDTAPSEGLIPDGSGMTDGTDTTEGSGSTEGTGGTDSSRSRRAPSSK